MKVILSLIAFLSLAPRAVHADDVVRLANFAIDRNEVTIARFEAFIQSRGETSAAEREGGGHEWGAGWERRAGWTSCEKAFRADPVEIDLEPLRCMQYLEKEAIITGVVHDPVDIPIFLSISNY